MRRWTYLGTLLLLLAACADPAEAPDASVVDAGEVDAGKPAVTHVLERSSLAPAAQSGSAADFRIRGHLRSSEVHSASNGTHEIRGGFVPLTR